MSFDCIVRGGTLATAERAFRADIGISDGRIAAIEPSLRGDARSVIDARGLVVAPGAVDVHTPFDPQVGDEAPADDYESPPPRAPGPRPPTPGARAGPPPSTGKSPTPTAVP